MLDTRIAPHDQRARLGAVGSLSQCAICASASHVVGDARHVLFGRLMRDLRDARKQAKAAAPASPSGDSPRRVAHSYLHR
jgi:hypothetical protein